MTSQVVIETSSNWARLTLDDQPMYDVPAEEWRAFHEAMLRIPTNPPALPAENWATIQARSTGSAPLREGERQQLLISAVQLAIALPEAVLFEDEPFDTFASSEVYHGKHLPNPRPPFLYVPSPALQIRLLNDVGASREMCAVGYLFDLEVEDENGNSSRLFYRPYNTGFATSSRWPVALQDLRSEIEDERNP